MSKSVKQNISKKKYMNFEYIFIIAICKNYSKNVIKDKTILFFF